MRNKEKIENIFLHFINEQRKECWTEYTAWGHITIPHSQSHRSPDHWKVSVLDEVIQVSVCEKTELGLSLKEIHIMTIKRDEIVVLVPIIWSLDQVATRPFLALPCQPDPVGSEHYQLW